MYLVEHRDKPCLPPTVLAMIAAARANSGGVVGHIHIDIRWGDALQVVSPLTNIAKLLQELLGGLQKSGPLEHLGVASEGAERADAPRRITADDDVVVHGRWRGRGGVGIEGLGREGERQALVSRGHGEAWLVEETVAAAQQRLLEGLAGADVGAARVGGEGRREINEVVVGGGGGGRGGRGS